MLERIESRRVGKQRVAPSEQDVGLVTVGDMVGLVDAGRHLLEVEAISRVSARAFLLASAAGPNSAAAATPSVPRIMSRRL